MWFLYKEKYFFLIENKFYFIICVLRINFKDILLSEINYRKSNIVNIFLSYMYGNWNEVNKKEV